MTAAGQASDFAVLGGGCFWCLEAVYEQVAGVEQVVSGYCGGKTSEPTYRDVCGGATGHAEVVKVVFNPTQITYREILEIFFAIHDPTTLNRQGADMGTQYRSVIFTKDNDQEQTARSLMAELTKEKVFPRAIVTEVSPLTTFYAAEQYHQNYYQQHSEQAYCQAVINPKLAKFRQHFASKIRTH